MLFTDLIELLLLTGYAGSEQKSAFIVRVVSKLDLLKFFMQVAWEVKCLDHKKYAVYADRLNEIGRMIGGWKNFLQKKATPTVAAGAA